MRIISGYTDNVEYRFISETQGSVVIEEPINFEEGNENIYERDKKSKGFLTNKTNNLQFYNKGASFLRKQINLKGTAETVLMRKYIKNEDSLDQEWRLVSTSYIDLTTVTFDESNSSEGLAKAKASEGGLKKEIDSKMSDDFDLTITEDFNGEDLGALNTVELQLEPRKIFLRSRIEAESGDTLVYTVTGNDDDDGRAIPFKIDYESDDNIEGVLTKTLAVNNENYATLGANAIFSLFYKRPELQRTLVLNGTVTVRVTKVPFVGFGTGILEMALLRYINGASYNFGERITLNTGGNIMDSYSGTFFPGETLTYTFVNQEVIVEPGESLTIGVLARNLNDGITMEVVEAFLEIEEDSRFPATTTRAITYMEAATRLVALATGRQNAVVSDLLSTGALSEKLLTQGFWVRGFPDIVGEGTDNERRIQFNTSLEDLFDDINLHEPVAWWVEEGDDGLEYLRIESYADTQQNFVGIPYAETIDGNLQYIPASEVNRNVLGDNFFGTIIIGSEKGGDNYEEVFGLQSIQGKATYGTVNKNSESKYEALSPYRLGDIDIELARRKPYSQRPDEDTRYDSDIMVIDCQLVNGTYYVKKWSDSFTTAPTGVYDVDSAYNLEHTPARFLLKHSNIINSGLYHYPNDRVRFQSSNCNSAFKGTFIGETEEIAEGQDISHTLLSLPYIRPWSVKLNCEVPQEVEDKITGKTDGVYNWFGLIAVNIRGNIEYFRLIKVDVNGEGKHELVEAYRR